MLTKNYIHALASIFVTGTGATNLSVTGSNGGTTNLYGHTAQSNYMAFISANFGTSISTNTVVFGTGTTPPTIDDYTLSGDIITGINITCLTASRKIIVTETGVTVTNVYSIVNNNPDAVTVGEIAWFGSVYTRSNTISQGILFDRSVLPAPVTIPAGATALIEYTIDFNYPTV